MQVISTNDSERQRWNTVLYKSPPLTGKCLGLGTLVLMHDGTRKPVEQIQRGDRVMGPDSNPRVVVSTTRGFGPMYEIQPKSSAPWTCNDEHILTLRKRREPDPRDMTVNEFLASPDKEELRLFTVGVDFPHADDPGIGAYALGAWLGDGCRQSGKVISCPDSEVRQGVVESLRNLPVRVKDLAHKGRCARFTILGLETTRTRNRFARFTKEHCLTENREKTVPHVCMTASRAYRLELLAGLLDTDGHFDLRYEIVSKWRGLAQQILYLARSLGFGAVLKPKLVWYKGENRTYWRVGIDGSNLGEIPCRVPRKQASPSAKRRSTNWTRFDVKPLGEGPYFGFTLAGEDRHFLLGDFTVTHNTHCVGSWTKAGPLLYIQWDPKSETIDLFPNVYKIVPESPKQFELQILPQIMAGKVEYDGKPIEYVSVAMDSLSFWARDVELEIIGSGDDMPAGGWQVFANRVGRVLAKLGSLARSPSQPHPANFLATIHEQERTKSVRVGGRTEVVSDGMLPLVSGRLRANIEGYFDLTLLPFHKQQLGPEVKGQPRTSRTVYLCRTVGREKAQQAGGRFQGKVLPPEVDGTYEGLCKAVEQATD